MMPFLRRLAFAGLLALAVLALLMGLLLFPLWWILFGFSFDDFAERITDRMERVWDWTNTGKDKVVRL
jgi:hypothetical protein